MLNKIKHWNTVENHAARYYKKLELHVLKLKVTEIKL